jgi:Protein of unknown function (DUF2924)/Protein of unknown function (DUF3489)
MRLSPGKRAVELIEELRQHWRGLFKAKAPPHLSRDLLARALAYRMQELALGRLRLEPQRRLRQIAQEVKRGGHARRLAPQLKPGTRLLREWRGRTYEVLVLERTEGASVAEIGQQLGWLPHTVRAAIAGLRHTGREVTRGKDENGKSIYRLVPVETRDR